MNNTPITARVKSGMFKTKEPLLNVGPAGVDGNNKTRAMPSPSKMKGYSMKSSPFKQTKQPRVTTNDDGTVRVTLDSQEKTGGKSGTNAKPAQDAKPAVYDTGKSLKGLSQKQLDWRDAKIKELGGIDNYHIEYGDATNGTKVKDAAPAVAATPATDATDGEAKDYEQSGDPMRQVIGEASTAYESRNNIRRGTQANRKTKKAEIKNAKSKAKGGAYYKSSEPNADGKTKRVLVSDSKNESSREMRKAGRIAKRGQKKLDKEARKANPDLSAKEQRKDRNTTKRKVNADAKVVKRKAKANFKGDKSKAKADQNERNYQLAKSESGASQEQSTQRKTGFSQTQTIRTKDVGKTLADGYSDKQVAETGEKTDVTSANKMKSSGFFKKKSPMKMNYFKK